MEGPFDYDRSEIPTLPYPGVVGTNIDRYITQRLKLDIQ